MKTKHLQIESLLKVAKSLGYVPRNTEKLSQGFQIVDCMSWYTHYISFTDMCGIHNETLDLSHLDLPVDSLKQIKHKRTVKYIKLQPVKYRDYLGKETLKRWGWEKGVVCQSDSVEVTNYENVHKL